MSAKKTTTKTTTTKAEVEETDEKKHDAKRRIGDGACMLSAEEIAERVERGEL